MAEFRVTRHLTVVIVALATACAQAQAQPQPTPLSNLCGPHARVIAWLATDHQEAQRAMGLRTNGSLIEVYARGDGSTWSIISTQPGGPTCMLASGTHWHTTAADRGQTAMEIHR